MADRFLPALRTSVERLRSLTATMGEDQLTRRAYPSEWSIADVLSHLGSGATISRRRLEDTLAGSDTPDDFAPGVWDEWNAKSPIAQRDDALAVDSDLVRRLDELNPAERRGFTTSMGPMTLDFEQFVAMRLNEHTFHTWDIEVVDAPDATLPAEQTARVIDNLELIARFVARPTGDTTTITVATTDPSRSFTIDLSADTVAVTSSSEPVSGAVTVPAEAFARLVYGRLDPEHTPAGVDGPAIDILRRVFPGL